jgi:hypothetical protein
LIYGEELVLYVNRSLRPSPNLIPSTPCQLKRAIPSSKPWLPHALLR